MQVAPVTVPKTTRIKHTSAIINSKKTDEALKREFAKKNPNQILSIAPEDSDYGPWGKDEGGLGKVVQQAKKNWTQHEHADIRTVTPYHAPDNPQGKIYVARILKDKDNNFPTAIDIKKTIVKKVDPNVYQLGRNEQFIMLANNAESKGALKGMHKIKVLQDTGVAGYIKGLKESSLSKEKIPYHWFKVLGNGPIDYVCHTPQVAAMKKAYGEEGAYVTGQVIGKWWDLYYANFNRAIVDAMPQLAKKEGFNPANVWMHDRPAFITQAEIARRSADGEKYYNGLKLHATLHNPGRGYQGYFDDKLGFLKVAFDEKDFDALTKSSDFGELRLLTKKKVEELTANDKKRLSAIFDKYFANVMDNWDENGQLTAKSLPNITMSTVASRRLNPLNSSLGTVSRNYGVEMKTLTDIAGGMTYALKLTPTIDVTNGNSASEMNFDKFTQWGRGGNGLSEHMYEYTPFRIVMDKSGQITNFDKPVKQLSATEIDALKTKISKLTNEKADSKVIAAELEKLTSGISVKQAKELNKKWLLDLMSNSIVQNKNGTSVDLDATQEALKSLFFNEDQINNKKFKIHGFLSKYSQGDRIFSSWGRSDDQKGFPTLIKGFYKFLTDKNVPESTKQHTKLLFGSANLWKEDAPDYQIIKDTLSKIQKLDNGKYTGNVCYIEGFFPNRLVTCIDYGIFTSRFEPCGLTPLESAAAANPSVSIKTGGAPNLVRNLEYKTVNGKKIPINLNNASGILSEHAFMLEPDDVNELTKGALKKGQISLDEGRQEILSKEVSEMFKDSMSLSNDEYDKISKNALLTKADWHENSDFNMFSKNGKTVKKTANQVYMEDIFKLRRRTHTIVNEKGETIVDFVLDYKDGSRSLCRMKKLTGTLGDASNIPVELVDNSIDANRRAYSQAIADAGNKSSNFVKKIFGDKRTYIAAAAIATVAGIAYYALHRDKGEKINKIKIGNSNVYF